MEILQIIVTGSVGAIKTSFIRTIATDEMTEIKANTTVPLNFGRLRISPTQLLQLYGIPEQTRFDFMWNILIAKAHAYILLTQVAGYFPLCARCRQEIV